LKTYYFYRYVIVIRFFFL